MCKGPEVRAREAASPGPGAEGAETGRARSGGDPAPQVGRTTWVPAFPSGPSCKLLTGREGDTHRYCFWSPFRFATCFHVYLSSFLHQLPQTVELGVWTWVSTEALRAGRTCARALLRLRTNRVLRLPVCWSLFAGVRTDARPWRRGDQ